ncbi:MAG: hypothetical protein U5K37_08480 [Natrialbaceae archaeon]|nr:hypothetical protein [Natrialbaceae archaeon]
MPNGNFSVKDISATGSVTADKAGGLIGSVGTYVNNNNTVFTIETSFATGTIQASGTSGGIIAEVDNQDLANVTLLNNYWDTQSSGESDGIGNVNDTGVTGLTTAEMQGDSPKNTMIGMDFWSVWRTHSNPDDYPTLRWQNPVYEDITVSVDTDPLVVGQTANFSVIARSEAGIKTDVTDSASLSSSDPTILSVGDGVVTGEADGTANLSATYSEFSDSISITVTDDAVEVLPENYHGSITINGAAANAGTVVEAMIDGEVRGTVEVTSSGSYGSTSVFDDQLIVSGTEDEAGQNVSFRIIPANQSAYVPGPANETSPFSPDTVTNLALSASLEPPQPATYNLSFVRDGGAFSVGIPGAMKGTLGDIFPNGVTGLTTIYTHTDDGWKQVYDMNHTFEALDTFVVTTVGDFLTTDVQIQLENNTAPANATLEPGWNHLAAPAYTDAETAFGAGITETLLTHKPFGPLETAEHPDVTSFNSYTIGATAWGDTPPMVSPFTGTFVYATANTTIPVQATEIKHKQGADEKLGLP